jgi:hypothetical protein
MIEHFKNLFGSLNKEIEFMRFANEIHKKTGGMHSHGFIRLKNVFQTRTHRFFDILKPPSFLNSLISKFKELSYEQKHFSPKFKDSYDIPGWLNYLEKDGNFIDFGIKPDIFLRVDPNNKDEVETELETLVFDKIIELSKIYKKNQINRNDVLKQLEDFVYNLNRKWWALPKNDKMINKFIDRYFPIKPINNKRNIPDFDTFKKTEETEAILDFLKKQKDLIRLDPYYRPPVPVIEGEGKLGKTLWTLSACCKKLGLKVNHFRGTIDYSADSYDDEADVDIIDDGNIPSMKKFGGMEYVKNFFGNQPGYRVNVKYGKVKYIGSSKTKINIFLCNKDNSVLNYFKYFNKKTFNRSEWEYIEKMIVPFKITSRTYYTKEELNINQNNNLLLLVNNLFKEMKN